MSSLLDARPRHPAEEPRELRFVDVPVSLDYEMHRGPCCESCIQDAETGAAGDLGENCCCLAIAAGVSRR